MASAAAHSALDVVAIRGGVRMTPLIGFVFGILVGLVIGFLFGLTVGTLNVLHDWVDSLKDEDKK